MPYDSSDWKLNHIVLDSEEAENIGHFIVQWGRLEEQLDRLFPVLFRMDGTLSVCITANLGTKPKIEMLQSALNMLSSALPPEEVSELNWCLDAALEYSSKYRNLLAHGRPLVFTEEGETSWTWVRYAARKQVTLLFPEFDGDEWRMACGYISIVTEGLFNHGKALYPIIWSFKDEDWDRICEMRGKSTG